MPEVKAKSILTWGGVRYDKGDSVPVDDATAERWAAIGLAEAVKAEKPAEHKPAAKKADK